MTDAYLCCGPGECPYCDGVDTDDEEALEAYYRKVDGE